jgi:hypothetical protein
MGESADTDEDEAPGLYLPIDRETRERLARMAHALGRPPLQLGAELLHDLLLDDERANRLDEQIARSRSLN